MSKKLKWEVTLEGKTHGVECVTLNTLYDVYVDGELAIKVPRKKKNDNEDSEYDLRIGNKRCQFVVYGGVPDLCVDGILLGAERDMERQELRNRLLKIFVGMLMVIVTSYATFYWVMSRSTDEPAFGGPIAMIPIWIFLAGGIYLVFSGLKRKKEY